MLKVCSRYLPSRLLLFVAVDGILMTFALLWSLDLTAIRILALSPVKAIVVVLVSVAVCLWCFYFFDVYDLDATRSGREVLLKSLRSLGIGILLLAPVWWLVLPPESNYRGLEISLILFLLVLCSYRLGVEWVRHRVLPGERVLLVGSGPSIQLLAEAMREKLGLPLRLTGVVPAHPDSPLDTLQFAICGHLGEFDKIMRVLRPDRIAIGVEPDIAALSTQRLVEARRRGIRVDDAITLYEEITGRVPVDLIGNDALAFGAGFGRSRVADIVCRAGGALLSASLIVLLSPVFLLLSILIKLDSRGPVFYQQERVGFRDRPFFAIKFRSMRVDAEKQSGPVWAAKADPRVTRVGRVLRTLRLDELPQLWNVAKGEMSLVGPRPERPHFVSKLQESIPFYELRHSITPGITGWAQVCASYGATVEESSAKLEYDLFYLKHRSLAFDALILFKTVKIMLFGRGAR